MYTIEEQLATPCAVDIEITTACNHSCRYCYNFWRHDEYTKMVIMSKETLDRIIDQLIECKVFNVVLTGGEPFTNFDVLLHGVKRLTEAGILVSCNTNLTLATPEKLRLLRQAGLPHILTSLSSYDPETNDLIFNRKGSYQKIIKAIISAIHAGIKISINSVVSQHNLGHIYKTGILAHSLGVSNLFLTRVVPSASCPSDVSAEFTCTPEQYIPVLDDAIRLKKETGINVGSLIQYPVCFLKDVDKYVDFVGRGCSAGKKMVCINADSNTHACFHEKDSYGNVLEIGLKKVWDNLKMWRDNSLVPAKCQRCKWLRWCEGGCRIFADTLDGPDYMCKGPEGLPDPVEDYQKSMHLVNGGQFRVRPGLRSREENGFWLVHIVGAWITRVSPPVAQFIIERTRTQQPFTLQDFPAAKEDLANLLTKNIVEKVSSDSGVMAYV